MKDFCKAMMQGEAPQTCRAALRKACKAHAKMVIQAASGLGISRHLFALQMACMENGLELPRLLSATDTAFARASSWKLSTSHVAAPRCRGEGITFHPFDKEAVGIVYGLYPAVAKITVMSDATCEWTDSEKMVAAIEEAAREIWDRCAEPSKM